MLIGDDADCRSRILSWWTVVWCGVVWCGVVRCGTITMVLIFSIVGVGTGAASAGSQPRSRLLLCPSHVCGTGTVCAVLCVTFRCH